MWILIGAVATASLLGSMHCVGMCGPLALWASGSGENVSRHRAATATAGYHLGRLLTYTLAGAVAGWVGGLMDMGGQWIGIQLVAARIVGLLMVFLGGYQLWNLFHRSRRVAPTPTQPPLMTRILIRLRPMIFQLPLTARALATGLLTALLPCGWLYLFALVAAGTGTWLAGSLVMAAFWLGTVPALVGLVVGTHSLAQRFRKLVPAAVAILLIAGGCYTASGRGFAQLNSLTDLQAASDMMLRSSMPLNGQPAAAESQAPGDFYQAVEVLVDAPLPCCVDHGTNAKPPGTTPASRETDAKSKDATH
ncbi:MAG: sulfite exporter TauE/SafE family protein [bacterium]|nr:sulfite exporter TauE/SafE family protein [bacterium]